MKKIFTISVFSENHAGMLHRITSGFTRRKINIESLTVSESEVHGIHRYTIVVNLEEENVRKLVTALEKQIDVHKVLFHGETDVVYQEIALYKVPTEVLAHGGAAEQIVRKHHARVLSVEAEFTVIEKTGHREDTQLLFQELEPFGILEFVRSGRVAITKPMKQLHQYLHEIELASAH